MQKIIDKQAIAGVILAGGQGRRLGGVDKASSLLDGRPLIDHVIPRVQPQVSSLIINASGDPDRFARHGFPVVPDVVEGFAGPLAGILTGMNWISEHRPEVAWLASFAVDTPFLPLNLVATLAEALVREGGDIACARSGDRTHPVVALWPVRLITDLRSALIDEDIRKIDRWTARHNTIHVDFSSVSIGEESYDPFFNINRPDDLIEAERIVGLARQ